MKSSRSLLFSFSVFQEIIKSKITNIKNLLLVIKVTRLGKPILWVLKLSRKSDQIIKIENWTHTSWIISRMHWWESHSQLVSLKKILQCVSVSSYIDVLNFKLYVHLYVCFQLNGMLLQVLFLGGLERPEFLLIRNSLKRLLLKIIYEYKLKKYSMILQVFAQFKKKISIILQMI